MPTSITPAHLTRDAAGTPVSEVYGDIYHSASGGHDQARHVFIAGNGLPQRWQGRERFVILETGFGLGLNFLATWLAWRNDPLACRELHFVSLEKHPFTAVDLAIAYAAWPELSAVAEELCQNWPALVHGQHRLVLDGGRVVLTLVLGDAPVELPKLSVPVDAFYLDGFSPKKNPELWSPELFRALARLARSEATLATWSVAGTVRQSLIGAGFTVQKRPGFAGKWHMLVGRYQGRLTN